jgi:hypothetical protein
MTPAQLGALSNEHVAFHSDKPAARAGGAGSDLLAMVARR